ncbi:MAG: hypothetical protein QOK19_1364 [Solirubrobacteraceae bacterium]|jgi:uncharacterized membrane protein|nr:vitamin epoxide reductase family protein [Solirubrobacterales bacterium]MEA2215803.1 hypothetical protein [Solirubrobacteraceae bacterium]
MSARTVRIVLIVTAVLGVGLASYLTYIHYAGIKPLCGRNGGSCEFVQTSQYSDLAGVPVALLGLIGYVLILGSLLAPDEERFRFATAALVLGGFAFSAYLTYREVFTLEAICEYCVSSAVLLTVMLPLSLWRFLRGGDTGGSAAPVAGPPADQPAALASPT